MQDTTLPAGQAPRPELRLRLQLLRRGSAHLQQRGNHERDGHGGKGGAQADARPRAKGQPLEAVQRLAARAEEAARAGKRDGLGWMGAGGGRRDRRQGTWDDAAHVKPRASSERVRRVQAEGRPGGSGGASPARVKAQRVLPHRRVAVQCIG